MEFIALALAADRQAIFAQKLPYGPVNGDALKLLPKETLEILPTADENLKRSTFLDVNWWADNGANADTAFNKWIVG